MNTNNLPEATLQDIKILVEKMFREGLLFTKFDVTKIVRNNGFHAMHKDVKRVMERDIVSLFPVYDYDSTRTMVAGSPVILYHPISADINDYDPDAISKSKASDTKKSNPPIPSHSNNYSFDKHENRYTVKADIARKAGFPAGATVYLKIESGKIILNKQYGRKITSDCYSNIRIRKGDFEKAFSPMPSEIKIEVTNGRIEIVAE